MSGREPAAPSSPRPDSSPDRIRMVDYLRARAAALEPVELRARFRAAAGELAAALDGVTEAEARRHPLDGEWSLAQVVDHVAQTTIRAADELRHLLAGRRPPAPPVYEALVSGAAARAPWAELREGLQASVDELDALLAGAGGDPAGRPTVRAILVVNRTGMDGLGGAETFDAELTWREYALVQRLHVLDHRTQARRIRAALGQPEPTGGGPAGATRPRP